MVLTKSWALWETSIKHSVCSHLHNLLLPLTYPVSILFVGYLLGQIPSNMALTRFRPSMFIAIWFGIWGMVSLLTFLVKDFGGMLAARFFLGFTEAPFYPGALYIISIFCKLVVRSPGNLLTLRRH